MKASGPADHRPDRHAEDGASPRVCTAGTCLTCSDSAVEVVVVRLLGDGRAIVETGAGQEEISVALVSAAIGDTVLVHAGEALAVVGAEPPGGSVEELYPFLYAGTTDVTAVLAQATASTVAKVRAVCDLRTQISAQSGERLAKCARDAAARFAAGGRLLTFGNGGSATDAQQIATLFLCPGPTGTPLPAVSLAADTAVLTALSNDIGVDVIFARQIAALGTAADIALGLSTSGNSENLLRAFEEASRAGMMTVGIAGYGGGKMAELECLDYLFVAPSDSIHRIQEAQTTIYHILWELIMTHTSY